MRKLFLAAAAMACALSAGGAANAKTLGIVALLANDALNIDVIGGATEAAKAAGWDVQVIDTQASADQANAAMNTFAVKHVDAMFVLAFASSSIGGGLDAARQAHIPVATWGGEIVPGIVVATSGRQVGDDITKYLLSKVGDNADILALTFHPGKLCIDRGIAFDEGVKGKPGIHVTYSEITVPGQVQVGNALTQAWLTGHPPGGDRKLGIWSCWDEPTTGAVAASVTVLLQDGNVNVGGRGRAGPLNAIRGKAIGIINRPGCAGGFFPDGKFAVIRRLARGAGFKNQPLADTILLPHKGAIMAIRIVPALAKENVRRPGAAPSA